MNWRSRLHLALDPSLSIEIEDERYLGAEGHRPAAVLIAITDRPEPGVILTQRPTWLRSHAGQVAFPGGKVDDGDENNIAAALREAHEELNLPPTQVDVIGVADVRSDGPGVRLDYEVTLQTGIGALDVRFQDLMYLNNDGSIYNKAVVSKFGLRVGRVEITMRPQKAPGV
jgi:8-oxo-dGTP pyrophosphatase MutT (NUDIX family)